MGLLRLGMTCIKGCGGVYCKTFRIVYTITYYNNAIVSRFLRIFVFRLHEIT